MKLEYAKEFDKFMSECELIENINKSLIGEGKYVCSILDLSMYKIPQTSKRYMYIQLLILDVIADSYNFEGESVFWKWELNLNNYKQINSIIKDMNIPIRNPSAILRYDGKDSAYEEILVYVDKRKGENPQINKIPGTVRYRFYVEDEDEAIPF